MRTDTISFLAICYLAFICYVAFGCVCAWPQQIPLESHFDGQDQSGAFNMDDLESAKASIAGATIDHATINESLRYHLYYVILRDTEIVPGSQYVLSATAIEGVSKVIPIDIEDLLGDQSAYSSIGLTGSVYDATDQHSQYRFEAGNKMILGATDNVLTISFDPSKFYLNDLADVHVDGATTNQNLSYDLSKAEWFNQDQPYYIGGIYNGKPAASLTLLRIPFPCPVQFETNFGNSQFIVDVSPTNEAVFTFYKNEAAIATVNVATGETAGTFTLAGGIKFATGEILKLKAPASQDTTMADIGFTLIGARR
ncbi:MAG TPA: hypothetical protein PK360_00110 [bacterium]|nr:hypothetical protein [bacterium]